MRLFGWVPPRHSLVKDGSVLVQYENDPDERLRMHIQDVAYDSLRDRLNSMDEAITELRGMMARHKIKDERKPATESRTFFVGGQPITMPVVIKDRRGRKT